jgi:hypothetical protein
VIGRSVDVSFCFADGFDGEKGLRLSVTIGLGSTVGLGVGTVLVGDSVGCFVELLFVEVGLGRSPGIEVVCFDGLLVENGPVGANEEFNI